jgi:hypothetical protein
MRPFLQRCEQYFTSSQTRAHLRRQLNGRPQVAHVFSGRSRFERMGHHELGQLPSAASIPAISLSSYGFE